MTEEVQYRIEIQDGQGFEGEGEVMVVLDLNGQDLPESVAQTILELAHNSRHGHLRGAQHLAHFFVEEAKNQSQDEQLIEYVTKVDRDDPTPMETGTSVVTEVKIEDMDNIFSSVQDSVQLVTNIQTDNQEKILVHDLAELEQLRVGSCQTLTHLQNSTASRILVNSLPDLDQIKCRRISRFPIQGLDPPTIVFPDSKVEVGVQCEIINSPEKNVQIIDLKKVDTANSLDEDSKNIKSEPLWADDEANATTKPAEPEETALIPNQPIVEKSCPHCEFACSQDIELGRHLKQVHKEKKPFLCSICGASFELELSFQIHDLAHVDKPVLKPKKVNYVCPVCNIQCKTHSVLSSHAKKEHNLSTVYTCTKCRFACSSKKELLEHNKSPLHKGKRNKISICPVCKVACLRLSIHLSTSHPDHKPYSCDQCNYQSKTTYAMRTHMLTHTDSKDFVCPECKRACKSQISLKRHIKNHNPVRKYHCSLCSFSTNDGYEFKRHGMRVHTRKTYYSCKFCNLSFVNHCDLKLHAMSEHKSRDSFYCKFEQCDFSCETRVEFKRHVQTHTGKHRYLCEICDFTTPWRAHLDRHLATHTNLRPFKCDVCGYECREKINLKKHMVIHSEDKPFQCTRCPYTCKLKNLLDSHTRIMHTSLKPYACSQCTYTTKTASNLKKHMWIHEQYRPYECRYCNYTAREKNKLRRHESLKHKSAMNEEPEVKPAMNTDMLETYSIVFSSHKL